MLETARLEATMNTPKTAAELAINIGAEVLVQCESIRVACVVKDAKNSWGRVRLLVEPIQGAGSQWVELGRVSELSEAR
jgi:hypothetical protein